MWAAPRTRPTDQLLPAAPCPPWEFSAGGSSGRQLGSPQWVFASPGLQGKWSGHDPLMSVGLQTPSVLLFLALLQVTAEPCSSPPTTPWTSIP